MIHLVAFALCLTGFAALAFATRRQQREIIGKSLLLTTTYALRVVGTCALLVALGILVAGKGWSLGLVMFSGHTTLAAGVVYCILILHAGRSDLISTLLAPPRSSKSGEACFQNGRPVPNAHTRATPNC